MKKWIRMIAALVVGSTTFGGERIQNGHWSAEVTEDGAIALSSLSGEERLETLPGGVTVSKREVKDNKLRYQIQKPKMAPMLAEVSFAGRNELVFTLSGDRLADFAGGLAYPSAWTPKKGDVAFWPSGEGMACPVDDPRVKVQGSVRFNSGMGASMGLFGFTRGGRCVATALRDCADAMLQSDMKEGLRTFHVMLEGEKGKFGYNREIRFYLGCSIPDCAAWYRGWRESLDEVVTLNEKQKMTPNLAKFPGCADIWIWDDNAMNRLYGRPDVPASAPRDVKRIADEMTALGMAHVLWNGSQGETPEDCAYLKSKGFLVGRYDIYRDVLPPWLVNIAIPSRVARSVNTPYFDQICRIEQDGSVAKSWRIHGKDGKMHDQSAVCELQALWLTRKNVPPDVERVGYTSRLIDVQAGGGPMECYSPYHPCTRREGLRAMVEQHEFLMKLNLVVGVEVGSEATSRSFHYSEGLTSLLNFRAMDAGRRMTTLYYGKDIPPSIPDFMLNPAYRIPLWELVYHDCTVSYYYWGDSSNCCPELMPRRDLFCLLWGLPPIYSVDVAGWDKLKKDISASYRRATPSARETMYSRMTNFEYLTSDKRVQRTTFANGVQVTANFSDVPFTMEDGSSLAPISGKMTH